MDSQFSLRRIVLTAVVLVGVLTVASCANMTVGVGVGVAYPYAGPWGVTTVGVTVPITGGYPVDDGDW